MLQQYQRKRNGYPRNVTIRFVGDEINLESLIFSAAEMKFCGALILTVTCYTQNVIEHSDRGESEWLTGLIVRSNQFVFRLCDLQLLKCMCALCNNFLGYGAWIT